MWKILLAERIQNMGENSTRGNKNKMLRGACILPIEAWHKRIKISCGEDSMSLRALGS